MQFKHPEILYALFLLIIPIIIHLFQLRRFEKVAFTNVQFLKDVILQTRKSSQLKKWLTLITRLLLLACIIFAFAQPYQARTSSFRTKVENVIYLDNSYSMQMKGDNGNLLNTAVQDLLLYSDEDDKLTLFTNNLDFRNTTIKAIKNDLIQLDFSAHQLDYNAVVAKGKQLFSKDRNSIKNLVIISDFQEKEENLSLKNDSLTEYKLVQLKPKNKNNASIDSVYISRSNPENLELGVVLKNQGEKIDALAVSLYDGERLIAKTSAPITDKAEVFFTISNENSFKGKLIINDANLQYDNTLYYNIEPAEKINVLVINEGNADFLSKIFTDEDFNLNVSELKSLDYNVINSKNFIVLNEVEKIPASLVAVLQQFFNDGGSLLIIPSSNSDLDSYNQLFKSINLPIFSEKIAFEKRITQINFSHHLLKDVFDKKVDNFQYPKVNTYFKIASPTQTVLGYEDHAPFLSQSGKAYSFSASLKSENSNFKNSPLIVPVLYNIGKQSLKIPQLYYTIGRSEVIDVKAQLSQDDILELRNEDVSIVPLQKTFKNSVQLTFEGYPEEAGIYEIRDKEKTLSHLSFNYDRKESKLNYINISSQYKSNVSNSVASALNAIKSDTNVKDLWKWFVIFAIAFILIEMLLLKLLK